MSRYADFQILREQDVSYLDHAASSLTPDCVLDAVTGYYQKYRSNVNRGVYRWSADATIAYENARLQVASFIGADASEVVFTSGATEAINLAAYSIVKHMLTPGQVILLSRFEHHANLIPWQRLAKGKNCQIAYIPINDDFEVDWEGFKKQLATLPVALIAITHASNVLGLKHDIRKFSSFGVPVLVDGTQMVSHESVDVKALGCGFYVWSAHKMYGPTGIGALYVDTRYHHLMQPHYTGGGIVDEVTYDHATFQQGLVALEPGTPNIAGAIGFGRACQYINQIGFDHIMAHEQRLWQYFLEQVKPLGLQSYGPSQHMVYSFGYPGVHAHDVATILSDNHVMVRAGHHCCMPLMSYLDVHALTRVSLGIYNQERDVERFVSGIKTIKQVMGQ
ncbi:aminotransferase class V-fold PLP-dependent enzyme [Candidatus Synchoanobacter obligatus]|uniref:cysteine desulfurase n=1 Tax=Candidatus Synchoanobacter obligatus TaxID=2919597 RepID=A0ABT1L5P6_9GAMM|nr:cysteine desulfurase [Candidatus Synchoanobacter obligatus]MCP8352414.1 cysteine desulfurase [Candidatus Synchoanobacter obligatus]